MQKNVELTKIICEFNWTSGQLDTGRFGVFYSSGILTFTDLVDWEIKKNIIINYYIINIYNIYIIYIL